jgi:hypothetical protein
MRSDQVRGRQTNLFFKTNTPLKKLESDLWSENCIGCGDCQFHMCSSNLEVDKSHGQLTIGLSMPINSQ